MLKRYRLFNVPFAGAGARAKASVFLGLRYSAVSVIIGKAERETL
jgi:hypothetical protein